MVWSRPRTSQHAGIRCHDTPQERVRKNRERTAKRANKLNFNLNIVCLFSRLRRQLAHESHIMSVEGIQSKVSLYNLTLQSSQAIPHAIFGSCALLSHHFFKQLIHKLSC